MYRIAISAAGLIVWLTASVGLSQTHGNAVRGGTPTFSPSAQAVDQAPTSAPSVDQSDPSPTAKWRYRWYEGTWWYWSPSEKWYVWAVDHWVPYEDLAGSIAANSDDTGAYSNGSGYYSGYGNGSGYYGAY